MKLNTEEWKEFEIGRLFDVINSKPYHKGDVKESNIGNTDSINYITRTKFNNGLLFKVKKEEGFSINPKNTISFGAENADFFIQLEEYITGNKMYYIDTQKLTTNQSLFFKSVLQKTLTNKYGFTDGLTGAKLKKEKIKLPAIFDQTTNEYEPDWDFMEGFIQDKKEANREKLEHLKGLRDNAKPIDISDWKEFEVGKLFDVINSSPYHKGDIEESGEGNADSINYVTRTKFNNGLLFKVKKEEGFSINPKNTISFGAENADFFIQLEEYITGNKMYYIDTQKLTTNQSLFFKSVLQKTLTNKYGFTDGLTGAKLKKEKIKLPAIYNPETQKYEPDWEYMDEFIRNREIEVKERMRSLI